MWWFVKQALNLDRLVNNVTAVNVELMPCHRQKLHHTTLFWNVKTPSVTFIIMSSNIITTWSLSSCPPTNHLCYIHHFTLLDFHILSTLRPGMLPNNFIDVHHLTLAWNAPNVFSNLWSPLISPTTTLLTLSQPVHYQSQSHLHRQCHSPFLSRNSYPLPELDTRDGTHTNLCHFITTSSFSDTNTISPQYNPHISRHTFTLLLIEFLPFFHHYFL